MLKSTYRKGNPSKITQDIHYGYPGYHIAITKDGYPICGMTAPTEAEVIQKIDNTI